MKINVLAGHGLEFGGARFVLNNFVRYAIDAGNDVLIYNNMRYANKFAVQNDESCREPYDVTFRYGDGTRLRPADLLVIYSVETPTHYDPEDENQCDMSKCEAEIVKQQKNDGARTVFVNVGHTLAYSGAHFVRYHMPMLKEVESFITFGPSDMVMNAVKRADKGFYDEWFLPRTTFMQHNTLYKPVRKWSAFENKKRSQFYWQGRCVLWKGYSDWLDLKERCHGDGFDMNLMFNGLSPSVYVISNLTMSMKPKVFLPYIDYHRRAPCRLRFSNRIESKARIYPQYKYCRGFRAMQRAGFGMYTTRLKKDMNFFPEYATFDAIQAGAILCMPSWYWSKDRGFLTGKPADYGCVGLPDTDETLSIFIDESRKLQSNKELYDEYRERAWSSFIDSADFPGIVQRIIDVGMKSRVEIGRIRE